MEREIVNLINNSSDILIMTHINPDGDTLGSASALKSFIGERCDILIQINDNFNFPSTYSFLPHLNTAINLSILNKNYDLIIALDIASLTRIGDRAKEIFKNCKNTIAIDHHKTNSGYAKINFIKGGISSCGEVLYDLFKKTDVQITKEMAVGLYTAILTDSGCFKYESATSHTFKIASELSQLGINTSQIADLCYSNKPKNFILFQNFLVTNAKFSFKDKVSYALITSDIIKKFDAKDYYSEGICETLRSIMGVEIAFVIKETDAGSKVSIRTSSIDATKITDKFNGGGHKKAAGCTIKASINTARDMLLDEIKALI